MDRRPLAIALTPMSQRRVHIPQLQLTVTFSREITPEELLAVIAELRADVSAQHATKPKPRQ